MILEDLERYMNNNQQVDGPTQQISFQMSPKEEIMEMYVN